MAQNSNDIVDELEIDDVVGSAESSRFSSAKIGRFLAVALFLLLGTFAVIYSMTRPHAHDADHDHGDHGHVENIGSSLVDAGNSVADKTGAAISSIKENTNAAVEGVAGDKYGQIIVAGRNAADKFAKTAISASTSFPKAKPQCRQSHCKSTSDKQLRR